MRRNSDDQLVAELWQLGLRHLSEATKLPFRNTRMTPLDLICGLVITSDARIQMSLIPLFLHCPWYYSYVPAAVDVLVNARLPKEKFCASPADTLRLLYQAAVYIQMGKSASQQLPDLYARDYGCTPASEIHGTEELQAVLNELAKVHTERAGSTVINWAATYSQQLGVYEWYAVPIPP